MKNADEEPQVHRGEGWRPLVAVKKKHPSHMTLGFAKAKQSFVIAKAIAKAKGDYAER